MQLKRRLLMKKSRSRGVFWGVFLVFSFSMLVFLMAADQPELTYSTYVEGQGTDLAVDGEGYAYVARFAGRSAEVGGGNPGGISTLVSKIDVAGDGQADWHTWLGGSSRQSHDRPGEVAMDSLGNLYITGRTNSPDFPTTDGSTLIGEDAQYLSMLSSETGGIIFSTLIDNYSGYLKPGLGVGGVEIEYVYVAGGIDGNISLTQFIQQGDSLGFGWSELISGNGNDYASGVAVDNAGNAYVTGITKSTDLIDHNGDPITINGPHDAFVAKFDTTGALVYLTTLGGNNPSNNEEFGIGINVDASGRVYVTGRAASDDFPTTSGAVSSTYSGAYDGFLAVYEPDLSAGYNLLYSTYLGGSDVDRGCSVDFDGSGNANVFGYSDGDAILWVIDPDLAGAASLVNETSFGGSKTERGYGARVHTNGSVYMTGMTDSRDFPLTPDPYLDSPMGGFLTVLTWVQANDLPTVAISSPTNGATFESGALIDFAGAASDTEDGDLTASIAWVSNIDGSIGSGGSFQAVLSDGVHTITASVTDSGGETGSDSISITVGDNPQPDTIGVAQIDYTPTGGGNHLKITCTLDSPVEGAIVSIDLYLDGNLAQSYSGATDSQGVVSFQYRKAPSGTYTSVVTDVNATGYTWDGRTPPNSFNK
jgi:hypothetical protein